MWERLRKVEDGSSPLILAGVLLLTFAVYAPTLNDWFSGDDFWFLRSGQKYSFWEYFQTSFDVRQTGSLPELDRYRPLYPLVWWVQFALFDLNAAWYHVLAVLLHVANTALVWLIARRLLGAGWPAAFAALIFGLHPAYADAVAWLSGANRVFAAFPYLACLYLFMRFEQARGSAKAAFLIASFAAFLVAALMHSAGLTLILVLPAYTSLIARQAATNVRSWLPFVPFLAVAMTLMIAQVWVRDHLDAENQFSFGWHQYAIYGELLGKAMFPFDRVTEEGTALEALQGASSVLVLILALFLMTRSRTLGLSVFVVGWFFLALFPDTTLRVQSLVSGRLLYLAAAPLALMLTLGAIRVYELLPAGALRPARLALAAVTPVLIAGAFALTMRHAGWHSDNGERNEAFANAMIGAIEDVPDGGTLYVVAAPANIRIFNDTRLDALVELYYGELDTRSVTAEEAANLEPNLAPSDQLFRYEQ